MLLYILFFGIFISILRYDPRELKRGYQAEYDDIILNPPTGKSNIKR